MHLSLHKSNWKTTRTFFLSMLAGMLTAQIIATWFVHGSNMHLNRMVQAATDAGYFIIPAGPVTETLTTLKSAIGGGLFYTLSIGVGLTLISWAALSLWQMVLKRNRWVLRAYLLIWAGMLLWINGRGPTLYPTLFCFLVPLSTALTFLKISATGNTTQNHLWMVPVATLVLLTAIWATQLNANLFTAIRDHVLLSNPVGRSVNDFYYRYTLYAAESFKSLNQKTVRSYKIDPISDTRLVQNLKRRLAQYDMLYLPKVQRPDFTVSIDEASLLITTTKGNPIELPLKKALAAPQQWLQQLSKTSDRYAPLRQITLVGLLLGFPILLYLTVYSSLRLIIGMVLQQRAATFVASGLSLLIGLWLFIPMLGNRPVDVTKENIAQVLQADGWSHRVAALRYVEKNKIDIGHYPQYKTLLESALVVERYWLARALALSRSAGTYDDLKMMLGDHHPNVTCQVYYALGKRGRRTAIAPILAQMAGSNHWYAQWYGYRALRRLGWYPNPSKPSR